MNLHVRFFQHLSTLKDGNEVQAAYRRYKSADKACAFKLNGCLKSGLELDGELQVLLRNLQRSIVARNIQPLTLYRMTSDAEFIASVLDVLGGGPFRYAAFMSASGTPSNLARFAPSYANPLVLEITCPERTCMALMEANAGMPEDEYLLGCGTEFAVIDNSKELKPAEAADFLGDNGWQKSLHHLKLSVHSNPIYTNKNDLQFFDF